MCSPFREMGAGQYADVCRCVQMCADSKTLLVWNDPDLLTYALKKVQI